MNAYTGFPRIGCQAFDNSLETTGHDIESFMGAHFIVEGAEC
jgi:hypothetical protein